MVVECISCMIIKDFTKQARFSGAWYYEPSSVTMFKRKYATRKSVHFTFITSFCPVLFEKKKINALSICSLFQSLSQLSPRFSIHVVKKPYDSRGKRHEIVRRI